MGVCSGQNLRPHESYEKPHSFFSGSAEDLLLRRVLEHQGIGDHLLPRIDSGNFLHVTGKHLAADHFDAPEFTCLCPITGQPDFAHLVIDYAPKRWLLESKSLKLYLASFRNIGSFHEDATVSIGKRIVALIEPAYLRIGGYWFPRGGIPIDVFWQYGSVPEGLWLPDQGLAPYWGRR